MMSATMMATTMVMMMMFFLVMVVVLLLNIDYLGLRGRVIHWRRGAIRILVGKCLVLISTCRLISVHFIYYNYNY